MPTGDGMSNGFRAMWHGSYNMPSDDTIPESLAERIEAANSGTAVDDAVSSSAGGAIGAASNSMLEVLEAPQEPVTTQFDLRPTGLNHLAQGDL